MRAALNSSRSDISALQMFLLCLELMIIFQKKYKIIHHRLDWHDVKTQVEAEERPSICVVDRALLHRAISF